MVEAVAGGPWGQRGLTLVGESFWKPSRLCRCGDRAGDGAAGAGIATFKMDFADGEADDAAFVFAEELVFPEGGDAVEFERRAEALADVFQGRPENDSGLGIDAASLRRNPSSSEPTLQGSG